MKFKEVVEDRVKQEIPTKEELLPMVIALGVSALGKLPQYALQGAITVVTYELIKQYPQLIPIGITAYALFELLALSVGAETLRKWGFNSGIKSTSFFKGINMISPKHRRLNAYTAESLNVVSNIIGINPVGMLANLSAIIVGDPVVVLAHRITASSISGPINLVIDAGLLVKSHKK